MSETAYLTALKLLARRELSEVQIRQRLARRQHDPGDIDQAVARLKADRSLDDERVAGAIARSEAGLKKRGRLRVRRSIEAAGIAADIARRAVDETFQAIDGEAQLTGALERRLRGGAAITTEREYGRLFRYLLTQGFEADRIRTALEKRRAKAL